MERDGTRALSDVLDRIAAAAEGERVAISAVVEALGERSFAALILVFTVKTLARSPSVARDGDDVAPDVQPASQPGPEGTH